MVRTGRVPGFFTHKASIESRVRIPTLVARRVTRHRFMLRSGRCKKIPQRNIRFGNTVVDRIAQGGLGFGRAILGDQKFSEFDHVFGNPVRGAPQRLLACAALEDLLDGARRDP